MREHYFSYFVIADNSNYLRSVIETWMSLSISLAVGTLQILHDFIKLNRWHYHLDILEILTPGKRVIHSWENKPYVWRLSSASLQRGRRSLAWWLMCLRAVDAGCRIRHMSKHSLCSVFVYNFLQLSLFIFLDTNGIMWFWSWRSSLNPTFWKPLLNRLVLMASLGLAVQQLTNKG